MSPEERIATALLGWRRCKSSRDVGWSPNADDDETTVYFERPESRDAIRMHAGKIRLTSHALKWPDLTTLDGCRLFEDALVDKGLLWSYANVLHDTWIRSHEPDYFHRQPEMYRSSLLATPAQRVAACMQVLDEAGL